MSDARTAEHAEDTAGRHRGSASNDDAETAAPHGRHRRDENGD
ncbi:hypothetical protein [Actinacidiphila yeochonensis]|nr:hypothetical protein [Actinacidiphila yeochonensis]